MDLWLALGIEKFNTSKFSASEKMQHFTENTNEKSAQKWNYSKNWIHSVKTTFKPNFP